MLPPPLDYPLLSDLHQLSQGRVVFWHPKVLHACAQKGLITPEGDRLTLRGEEIVFIFHRYLTLLETGIPLTARIPKPYRSFDDRTWWRATFSPNTRVTFTRDFLYQGTPRGDERQPAKQLDKDKAKEFETEFFERLKNAGPYDKYEPCAYQHFCDTEAIVLKQMHGNGVVRIWAPYFDFCEAKYLSHAYWRSCGAKNGDPVFVRLASRGAFQDKISAVILPLDGIGWPDVDLSVFEKECMVMRGFRKIVGSDETPAIWPKGIKSKKNDEGVGEDGTEESDGDDGEFGLKA